MPDLAKMQRAVASIAEQLAVLQANVDELAAEDLVQADTAPTCVQVGDLKVSLGTFLALWKGQRVDLTRTQVLLVHHLATRPDWIRTREHLLNVLEYGDYATDRSIDTHVKRIRRAFTDVDPDFDQLETVYKAGYRWGAQKGGAA